MDFSFADDPDFLVKREAQWQEIKEHIEEGSTKKRVAAFREYFFTGKNPDELKISLLERITDFPLITHVSLQFVLQNYLTVETYAKQKLSIHGYIARMSFSQLSEDEKLELHNQLFGVVYNPDQHFPFLVAKQTQTEPLQLSPVAYLHTITRHFSIAIRGKYVTHLSFWFYKSEFLFSLFPYIPDTVFLEEGAEPRSLHSVNMDHLRDFWGRVCKAALNPERVKPSPVRDEVLEFLSTFKAHMDITELTPAMQANWEKHKEEAGL